ncbi:MAG: aminotransferase class V-fold PLP-dependent enzyme [Pseudomonadota bacterium]
MIDAAALARIRAETPGIRTEGAHLLACGSALMPQPVVNTIVDHTQLEAEIGGYEAHAARLEQLEAVYDKVAAHINAKRHEIALVENATIAWRNAFYSFPLEAGQRILTCESEYSSNYLAYLQRAKRDGVKIDVIPSDERGAIDLAALEAAIGPDVGLISITWIPTSGGLVNPAAAVGKIARAHDVPYLLDACQAAGQLRIDVEAIGCDFLSATGRKFLRGPRGTGFLYVAERWIERIEPVMIDLYSAEWTSRDGYQLRKDARRFEDWENAYALRAGLGAAFDYVDAVGIDAIEARVKHLADHCRTQLTDQPGLILRDLGHDKCGIVTVEAPGQDAVALVDAMGKRGFAIGTSSASSTRLDFERRGMGTLMRIAPHYYNTEDEVAACVEALGWLMNAVDRPNIGTNK